MSEKSRQRWILLAIFVLFSILLSVFVYAAYIANDGHIIYVLDDTYIHMAMAKNIVEYGVFGITPYRVSATSSSPFWTLLLALLYGIFGKSEWLPLFLNYLSGLGAIFIGWKLGCDAGIKSGRLGILLAAMVLLLPMVPVAFTGIEHIFHLMMTLLLIYFLWRFLSQDAPIRTAVLLRLGILSLVAVAVRYESLFLVVAASIALAVKRRWSAIAALITGAVISVCGFGIFNIANGGPFLPVSLLIKGRMPHVDSLIAIADALGALALRTLSHNTHMYILVLCLILLFWHDQKSGLRLDTRNLLILMALTAILLHLQYARLDWFYRYEAYLLGMAMTVLFLHIGNSGDFLMRTAWRKRSWIAPLSLWILLGLATSPLVVRSALAHHKTIPATKNIYEQQYQMGRFLQTFYNGASVAANDLGAINYLARLNCLDLTGLASYEVLLHIKNGTLSTAVIRELAAERGVQIAVVYNAWYQGPIALPEEWLPVGTWTIRNNIVCGDSTVTFVAVDDAEARQLSTHLRAFSAQLPPGVIWQEAAEQDTVNRHDSKMVER